MLGKAASLVACNAVLLCASVRHRLLKTQKVSASHDEQNRSPALPPAKNLKRAFECAVHDIYEVGLTGKVSQYRTPIVQRAGRGLAERPVEAEKRALSDAARALGAAVESLP